MFDFASEILPSVTATDSDATEGTHTRAEARPWSGWLWAAFGVFFLMGAVFRAVQGPWIDAARNGVGGVLFILLAVSRLRWQGDPPKWAEVAELLAGVVLLALIVVDPF